MKHKHIFWAPSIALIFPLLVLIGCNPSHKSNGTLNTAPKDIFAKRSLKVKNILNARRNLINQIKNKVKTDLTLIKTHEKDIIKESGTQLGIQCAIFDEIHYQNVVHDASNKTYPIDKYKIKLFHASLNYNIIRLKWLGEILIQMQAPNTKKGNKLYKAIINTGIEYYQKPFEALINQINMEQDNLTLLNVKQLTNIINNLNTIESLRKIWISFVDNIINDYRTDTDIKNNSIKLLEHIITKYTKIEDKINSIKNIAHKTNKILKTIKHNYYINQ
ncbi:virulence associated lipoprotein [Borrelia hermsii]|uniref:virulence associated lipoprotein n=1 Tax=Borrelia hermsii TaxID=140 RepID=UPI00046CCCFA|nr:virulence associated lipoprotein [Borrelia hermsii]